MHLVTVDSSCLLYNAANVLRLHEEVSFIIEESRIIVSCSCSAVQLEGLWVIQWAISVARVVSFLLSLRGKVKPMFGF